MHALAPNQGYHDAVRHNERIALWPAGPPDTGPQAHEHEGRIKPALKAGVWIVRQGNGDPWYS